MKKAERWTVKQTKRPARTGKRWAVYPPGHLIGGHVYLYRRFATWEQAITYVFDEGLKVKRQQSMRTILRSKLFMLANPSFVRCPEVFGDDEDRLVYRWDPTGREIEPWHGKATGQAS